MRQEEGPGRLKDVPALFVLSRSHHEGMRRIALKARLGSQTLVQHHAAGDHHKEHRCDVPCGCEMRG